jgi:hypothetical protein
MLVAQETKTHGTLTTLLEANTDKLLTCVPAVCACGLPHVSPIRERE